MASHITLLPGGKKLQHNSSFFREPYVFKYLPEYIKERFPQKVYPNGIQINLGACAQGEDVWSLEIVLEDDNELLANNSPINASDINPSVVNMAKSGILSFLPRTLDKAREVVPNIDRYFDSMPANCTDISERQALLDEYKALLEEGEFKKRVGSGEKARYISVKAEEAKLNMLYKISDKLKRRVRFKVIDFQKEFDTNHFDNPCLVIFRNALQHFNAIERELFCDSLLKALKPGSSLVIGSGDISKCVPLKLIDAGFEPLNPKYSRQEFQNPANIVKSKDPQANIFEKNRGIN